MQATTEEARTTLATIRRSQAVTYNGKHADRRYVKAIERSERQRDALERISGLLGTHPALSDDPFELADLLHALKTIDRRAL